MVVTFTQPCRFVFSFQKWCTSHVSTASSMLQFANLHILFHVHVINEPENILSDTIF